jgi:hypothetical protein
MKTNQASNQEGNTPGAGRHPAIKAAAIVGLTLLAYSPAMRAGFVFDDTGLITENPLIHADDGLYRFWFSTDQPDYFPLTRRPSGLSGGSGPASTTPPPATTSPTSSCTHSTPC